MKKLPIVLLAALALHIFLLLNIQFTAWPEMLSYPYLFSRGFKLYSDFVYPYPPLLTLVLAGFYKIFGFKILTLKIVSWLFILISDVFLFFIIKKILKKEVLAFLLFMPYLLLQSFLDGNMIWFDNALVLPIISAFYFFLHWREKGENRYLYLSSLYLTLAVLVKQSAIIYYPMFLLTAFSTSLRRSVEIEGIISRITRIKLLLVIPGTTVALFVGYLAATDSLKDFLNWAIYYPLTFWSKFPGYKDFNLGTSEIVVSSFLALPLFLTFLNFGKLTKEKGFIFAFLLFIASILAIFPRFSYFHLQPTIAILFLLFAYLVKIVSTNQRKILTVLIALVVYVSVKATLPWTWGGSTRFYNQEDREKVEIVKSLTKEGEKIFLLGLDSSIYVYSDRLPAKPWADNFGWYWEIPGFQETVITAFEEDPPTTIFYTVPGQGNWFDLSVYRPKRIVEYIKENYYLEGEPIGGVEVWKRKSPDM